MPLFDIDTARLSDYRPEVAEPGDFDGSATLAQTRAHDLAVEVTAVNAHLMFIEAYDLTFSGYGGHRVKGWYLRPAGRDEPLPAMVEYLGYGGGRGFPHARLRWPAAGYAYVVMDTRGQGTAATNDHGATPDPFGGGDAAPAPSPAASSTRTTTTTAGSTPMACVPSRPRALPGVAPARSVLSQRSCRVRAGNRATSVRSS